MSPCVGAQRQAVRQVRVWRSHPARVVDGQALKASKEVNASDARRDCGGVLRDFVCPARFTGMIPTIRALHEFRQSAHIGASAIVPDHDRGATAVQVLARAWSTPAHSEAESTLRNHRRGLRGRLVTTAGPRPGQFMPPQ